MAETLTLRRALLPLDGSELAEQALDPARLLGRRLGAELLLLHIVEQRPPATIHGAHHLGGMAEAHAYLERLAASLRAEGLRVATHVHEPREGDVARSIVAHAAEFAPDLIVLCSHGRGGLRELLFGRIAQQVLQHGGWPVLVLPPQARPPAEVRRIVVALDGTPDHEPALPAAAWAARALGAHLHLLGVTPTLATLSGERAMPGRLLPATTRGLLELGQRQLERYLGELAGRLAAEGLSVSAEAQRGDAAAELLRCIGEQRADLLVLASHGRAGLDAWLAGSVAPRLADRVPCPLLVVRAAPHAP